MGVCLHPKAPAPREPSVEFSLVVQPPESPTGGPSAAAQNTALGSPKTKQRLRPQYVPLDDDFLPGASKLIMPNLSKQEGLTLRHMPKCVEIVCSLQVFPSPPLVVDTIFIIYSRFASKTRACR